MKTIMLILGFLLAGIGYAQDTTQSRNENQREVRETPRNRNIENNRPRYFEIRDTTTYTSNNREYTFTPDKKGIRITRKNRDGEIDFANLRRTTADGYYMMVTTPEKETFFGRFDRQGNFRSYRYDPGSDTVIEENFEIQNPVRRGDQNRRSNRERNNNRRNNNGNNNRQ